MANMKCFFSAILALFASSGHAAPERIAINKPLIHASPMKEIKKLAREIEILSDWKDVPAFLQISKRILKLYELDSSKSTFSASTELKDLADVYRDGTTPPDLFYVRVKKLAQSIQAYLAVSN